MEEKRIDGIMEQVNVAMYLNMKLDSWKMKLAYECNVFVCGKRYLARRFDEINFSIVDEREAKKILIDNMNALLKYKYLTIESPKTRTKIDNLVKAMKANIRTNLIKVGDKHGGFNLATIPNWCIAFNNGVYDFKNNDWLFKYETIEMTALHNRIIIYNGYIIKWHVNIDFNPLGFSIMEKPFDMFLREYRRCDDISSSMKVFCNYVHTNNDKLSMEKAIHLSQVLGYMCLNDFTRNVCFINMKGQHTHVLLDRFFVPYVLPKPLDLSLNQIEHNKFATEYLQEHSQNISYEYGEYIKGNFKELTRLTENEEQSVEKHGRDSDSRPINNRMLFCIGSQDELRIRKGSPLLDRINVFDLNYRFSSHDEYLGNNCYYDIKDTSVSINDIIIFIYIAMYGIKSATNGFLKPFKFEYNDFVGLRSQQVENMRKTLSMIKIEDFMKRLSIDKNLKVILYDTRYTERLFKSQSMHEFFKRRWTNVSNLRILTEKPKYYNEFFKDRKEVFVRVMFLYDYLESKMTKKDFTRMIKEAYPTCDMRRMDESRMYVRIFFSDGYLRISH